MIPTIFRRCVLAAVMSTASTSAFAAILNCDGTFQNATLPANSFLDFRFDAEENDKLGYALEATAGGGAAFQASVQIFDGTNAVVVNELFTNQDSDQFTVVSDGVHTVRFFNAAGQPSVELKTNCEAAGPSAAEINSVAATQAQLVTGAAGASASFSSSALSNAMSARNGGGATVSSNRITFSSRNGAGDSGWTAWGTAAFTQFNGRTDGTARSLTFGLDYAVSPNLLVGVMAGLNTYEQTTAGTKLSGRATEVGPYVVYDLGKTFDLEAFLTYSRPNYDLAGASLQSTRVTGGVKLRAQYEAGGVQLDSHLSLRGFNETTEAFAGQVAARTVEQYVASLSTKATFNTAGLWQPTLGLGVDAISTRDGRGGNASWISPRASLGIGYASGLTSFNASIDAGRALRDTTDLTLHLGLSVRF